MDTDTRVNLTVLALIGAVLAVLLGIAAVGEHANETTQVCTVTEKDRTQPHKGPSDARIYTEQCGTFQVSDLATRGQFDSADTYAMFVPGHTYEVTTVGWRVEPFSWFPDVLGKPVEVTPAG